MWGTEYLGQPTNVEKRASQALQLTAHTSAPDGSNLTNEKKITQFLEGIT